MKNLFLAVMLLFAFSSCRKDINSGTVQDNNVSNATKTGKRIYFTNTGNWVDQNFNYSPGDTFVLKSNINYTYFSMSNVHDVTFINEGGVVHLQNGFNFNSCSNITITGTGSSDFYGFEVSGHTSGDVGIDINGKSTHITCNNIYIHDKTYGFWVKQEVEATCDQSLYYPNWYMDSVSIYNCMIKRMNQEGMYLGSTGENADRPNACGQYPYPMRISNISIHDNIVDSTGRGGIMLSGADKGKNEIYNNKVTRCGFEYNSYQGNGIVIGGNAYANIYHNTIKNTLCDGIWVLGCGTTRVRNNTIDSSGWLNGVYAGYMHGIAFDTRHSYPFTLSTFRIKNNTIGKHTDVVDIYIYNTMQNQQGKSTSGFSSQNNVIYNNNDGKAKVSTQNGIVYSTTP
ncbi:MAG: right-handed parallel beta-helix repeat-containing protein [Parafilimonas sp.]|nr:right-handed parallel beta-helix repeat-containing protein [Parafilimonas sp.]